MSMTTKRVELEPGMSGVEIRTRQFKSKRISISLLLPLSTEDAAKAAVLSHLLSRSTGAFPTPMALQQKLQMLYGAKLSCSVVKLGDYQILHLSLAIINDEYALEKENLSKIAADFLCDALLDPHREQGIFPDEDVAVCKRLVIEDLDGIINEKRKYALHRAFQILCPEEPFGIEIGGSVEAVRALDGAVLADFWRQILTTASMTVSVTGSDSAAPIWDRVRQRMAVIPRTPAPLPVSENRYVPRQLQEVTEEDAVTQGKLVLGFRFNGEDDDTYHDGLRLLCDCFGGGPYSRLFTIVREKMSLCYYCVSHVNYPKMIMMVDCGVSNENIAAAREEILHQLEELKQGHLDEELIRSAKMSLIDSARSVSDSLYSMEAWFLLRWLQAEPDTPQELIRRISAIKEADVVAAAGHLVLDTVFTLKAKEDAHE